MGVWWWYTNKTPTPAPSPIPTPSPTPSPSPPPMKPYVIYSKGKKVCLRNLNNSKWVYTGDCNDGLLWLYDPESKTLKYKDNPELCVDGGSFEKCKSTPSQRWSISDSGVIKNDDNACLQPFDDSNLQIINVLKPCDSTNVDQEWKLVESSSGLDRPVRQLFTVIATPKPNNSVVIKVRSMGQVIDDSSPITLCIKQQGQSPCIGSSIPITFGDIKLGYTFTNNSLINDTNYELSVSLESYTYSTTFRMPVTSQPPASLNSINIISITGSEFEGSITYDSTYFGKAYLIGTYMSGSVFHNISIPFDIIPGSGIVSPSGLFDEIGRIDVALYSDVNGTVRISNFYRIPA